MKRETNWRSGDTVRTTCNVPQHARPEIALVDGSVGMLGEMYRIQGQVECWAFWQGSKLSAIPHIFAERCSGPVEWKSCLSG